MTPSPKKARVGGTVVATPTSALPCPPLLKVPMLSVKAGEKKHLQLQFRPGGKVHVVNETGAKVGLKHTSLCCSVHPSCFASPLVMLLS